MEGIFEVACEEKFEKIISGRVVLGRGSKSVLEDNKYEMGDFMRLGTGF